VTAVVWLVSFGVAAARADPGPVCPPALAASVLEPGSAVAANADGLHELDCVYRDPTNGDEVDEQADWNVRADPGFTVQYPGWCDWTPNATSLKSTSHDAVVDYSGAVDAGADPTAARQVAASLLAQIEPFAMSCPWPPFTGPASPPQATGATTAPASTSGQSRYDPIGGLAAGAHATQRTPDSTADARDRSSGSGGTDPITGLAAAAAALVGVAGTAWGVNALIARRGGTAASTPATDAPHAIYDGPVAIDLLVNQGWLTPITRTDGSVGYRPTGDLAQYVSFDHGGWQPGFASGTTAPDGSTVARLAGIAYTPSTDGLIDSITIVATSPPSPTPAVATTATAMPSPLAPAATTTERNTDLGSQMLLDPTGEFIDADQIGQLTVALAQRGLLVPPTAGSPRSSAQSATQPTAAASSPFAALLRPSGGSLTISAADLPSVAPTWIAPDGTITNPAYAGITPTVTFRDGTISVRVTPYSATAQLVTRDGRIFVTEPTLHGPLADFVDTNNLRTLAQTYLDQTLNGPTAAHGLHITNVGVTPDGIHITTGPVTP